MAVYNNLQEELCETFKTDWVWYDKAEIQMFINFIKLRCLYPQFLSNSESFECVSLFAL